jgi:hypothetical protein
MAPRADLLDHLLGGVEDAAARVRSVRRRMTWEFALQGVRLSQGIADQRSRVEEGARRSIEQLRRGASRPFERVAGVLVQILPVAKRGDFRRLEGRVALLARELDALDSTRSQRLG